MSSTMRSCESGASLEIPGETNTTLADNVNLNAHYYIGQVRKTQYDDRFTLQHDDYLKSVIYNLSVNSCILF